MNIGSSVSCHVVGGDGLNQSVEAPRVGGHISQIGFLQGQKANLDLMRIIFRQTNLFGFFAPALAYIASQTGDTLPEPQSAPLSTLAHLQYLYNPGLKYPPAWTLQQFITNATTQIGPLLGPFAAEFLPPGDSGIQPWIDAARWMGWVLMEGAGKPALTTALTAQI